jgi:hypothetical protein
MSDSDGGGSHRHKRPKFQINTAAMAIPEKAGFSSAKTFKA